MSKLGSEDRREAILAAVTPLIADSGLDGVTTKALASAAGVSEALLYKHFPSKDDLYRAIQQNCIVHSTADAAQFDALPDSTECLVMMVWLLVTNICGGSVREERLLGDNRPLTRLVMRSLLDNGEFAKSFLNGAASGWVRKVKACAAAAHAAGDLLDSPDHASIGVWFSHHLAMAMVMTGLPQNQAVDYAMATSRGVRPPTEQLVEHAARFVLRGIGLTPEALERYYKPETFEFLRDAGRA